MTPSLASLDAVIAAMLAREPWRIDRETLEQARADIEAIRRESVPGTEYRG